MDLGLADARVLVVGGSRGMGRAAAETFAREGARTAVLARASDALDDTVASLLSAGSPESDRAGGGPHEPGPRSTRPSTASASGGLRWRSS